MQLCINILHIQSEKERDNKLTSPKLPKEGRHDIDGSVSSGVLELENQRHPLLISYKYGTRATQIRFKFLLFSQ